MSETKTPTLYGHALWKHMHDEHGLILLESEMHEIERLCPSVQRLKAELAELREAIKNAPHEPKCVERNSRLGFAVTDPEPSCTCWKSKALADEATKGGQG